MAILLAVSIVSTLLKQLKNHLALKKFEQEQIELYDNEAYAHDLERTIDQGLNDDTGFEPEEAEWRTLEANEEYKRETGEYYVDPQEIKDHYAIR